MCRKRAELDDTVADASEKAEKFALRSAFCSSYSFLVDFHFFTLPSMLYPLA
jgi:hypothetical protein